MKYVISDVFLFHLRTRLKGPTAHPPTYLYHTRVVWSAVLAPREVSYFVNNLNLVFLRTRRVIRDIEEFEGVRKRSHQVLRPAEVFGVVTRRG